MTVSKQYTPLGRPMRPPQGGYYVGLRIILHYTPGETANNFLPPLEAELLYFGGSVGAGIAGSRRLTQVPTPAWE